MKPTPIKIDEFIDEMEDYLISAGLTVVKGTKGGDSYYNRNYYYTTSENGHKVGDVNYEQFVYYKGNFARFRIPSSVVGVLPVIIFQIFIILFQSGKCDGLRFRYGICSDGCA